MDTHPAPGRYDTRPIGIFDSGVGGLTVLQAMLSRFPDESFLYLGDTARVPYGAKSARVVERYTIQVGDYLIRQGVKGLVVACNTASALGLPALYAHATVPVMGVIEPGCRAALSLTTDLARIGVIGTRSTVESGAYPYLLSVLSPIGHAWQVRTLACPLWVPLVEEGWLRHPVTRLIVEESLSPWRESPPAVVILGCTHYPLLRPVIQEMLGAGVRLVDSAAVMADELALQLSEVIDPAPPGTSRRVTLLVTDATSHFREVAGRFLSEMPTDVEMIDL